jgi:hypothetical protein
MGKTKKAAAVVKKVMRKASEVTLTDELLGTTKSVACQKQYASYIKKLWKHLEYAGEYVNTIPFPKEGLTDESLAKFVVALAESSGFSASTRKSVSASITCLLQENQLPNPFCQPDLYKNLHLAYERWSAYNRDNPREKKKAPTFSVEQGTAMISLPCVDNRTLLDKAVLVLAWYGGERIEDIYNHLSKNIKCIPYDFILNHCRK